MKLKDYMVGDWILSEHDFPMKVTAVGKDYVYADFDRNEGDPFEFDEKNPPKPIQLTPEILEKNGFYKDWDNKTYLMGELFRLTLLTDGMGYYLNKWVSMQIYSVHQLQHALRLCGLDELADNFKVE